MPDSVKISELPVLSSVNPGDIIPIVDETLSQTSRCTAAQIAVLGGGPPGAGTVSDEHVITGHLTVQKLGMTASHRFPVSGNTSVVDNTTGAAITRYQGTEQPITDFGLQWLNYQNSSEAAVALGAINLSTLTVSGTVTGNKFLAGNGTAGLPSFSFAADNTTGLSLNGTSLDVSAGGTLRLKIPPTGSITSPLYDNTNSFYPHMGVRAWAHITRTASGTVAKGVGFSSYTWDQNAAHYLTFSTNMPDTQYAVHITPSSGDSAGAHGSFCSLGTLAANTFSWLVRHNGNGAGESSQNLIPDYQCITVVR